MTLDLCVLTEDTRTIPVKVPQGTFNITYRPGALDTNLIVKERALIAERGSTEARVEILGDLLIAWDLTDKDKPLPLNAKSLRRLPLTVVGACWSAINEDTTAPKVKSGTSADG